MKHTFPALNKGEKYRIIFRLKTFKDSFKNEFVSGEIPKIDFGQNCICCNDKTNETAIVDPLAKNQLMSFDYKVPVCLKCTHHAYLKSRKATIFYGWTVFTSMLVLLGLYFLTAGYDTANSLIFFAIMFSVFVLLFIGSIKKYNARNEKLPNHFPNLKFTSRRNKEVILESGNLQLIKNVIILNEDLVALVTTDKESIRKSYRRIQNSLSS